MRHTTGGPAHLRALLIIAAILLTLLDTTLTSIVTRERRGVRASQTRHELRPAGKINEQVISDEKDSMSRNIGDRTRRSAPDEISLKSALPDLLQQEVQETLENHPEENTDIKRRWSAGRNMAVWGKRDVHDDDIDDVTNEDKRKWGGDRKMAVWGKRDDSTVEDVKRKWRNDQKMAVWGKRSAADDYANARKRKWRSGNRMDLWGKRKWSSRNMAVWGKRDWNDPEEQSLAESGEDEKRSWRGRDMAVWG